MDPTFCIRGFCTISVYHGIVCRFLFYAWTFSGFHTFSRFSTFLVVAVRSSECQDITTPGSADIFWSCEEDTSQQHSNNSQKPSHDHVDKKLPPKQRKVFQNFCLIYIHFIPHVKFSNFKFRSEDQSILLGLVEIHSARFCSDGDFFWKNFFF